ncbi:MAG: site-specific DNA-methyltransferase [Bacteroidales bacterium]|nr:site-specific DNA-methyltransferase [Bacteroidales bacterium]
MENLKHVEKQSPDGARLTLDALYQIAPSCFTEAKGEDGEIHRVVDFNKLRLLLGDNAVEDNPEVYDFTWVGKRAALQEAAAPINKTLRPCPEESVDWEKTQNLYIEGDNLEVLKLLQNSYMGKVKMIYIDPPYNTGNDFVYHDDFHRTQREEDEAAGVFNEEGDRMIKNTETNGKFHSDWCSMMYSRLMIARSLLTEDGAIFISIDDNELHSLKKICDEVFGSSNFRNTIALRRRIKSLNVQFSDAGLQTLNVGFEYVLVYAKPLFKMMPIRVEKRLDQQSDEGKWQGFWSNADRPTMRYDVLGFTPSKGQWRKQKDYAIRAVKNYMDYLSVQNQYESLEDYSKQTGITEFIRRDLSGKGENGGVYHWQAPDNTTLRTSNWLDIEVSQIQKEIKLPFDNPKNIKVPIEIAKLSGIKDCDLVLDFFSGSATTAHAVMQLNAEDGGNRKFIMVQLPEETAEDSEAYKAGYTNICEIGKERIRRAGKKIKAENPDAKDLDTGFRVFKCESSNYKDVAFAPKEYSQEMLLGLLDNIKEDRTDLDLLFDCMLRWGVELSLPLSSQKVDGCTIHNVNDGDLVACFDGKVTESVIDAIAALSPVRVVFRDNSFDEAAQKMNLFELFKQKCDWTDEEVKNNIRVI